MVTKRVIRINSSEAEHLAAKDLVAIAAAACDNGAAINKASNEQSKSSKSSAANSSDDNCMDQGGGEKRRRSLPSWDTANNNEPTIKRRRQHKSFVIDISDVPPQPPIPKSKRYVKEGASKYTGVTLNKQSNKWTAQIMIEGKQHTIGRRYDNEEEAAVDYARALFKYKGGVKEDREQRDSFAIDLSGVPPQPPIPKSSGRIKEGASKYTGVFLNQQRYKWVAQIRIDGKLLLIGYYDDEEEAAVDYARAVFKYKGGVVHPR